MHTLLGVSIVRIVVFGGSILGSSYFGKLASSKAGNYKAPSSGRVSCVVVYDMCFSISPLKFGGTVRVLE